METSFHRSNLPKSGRMRLRGWARLGFALVVLVAVPLVMVGLFRTQTSIRFNGVVDPSAESVAPIEASRIAEVLVAEGQSVKAGEPLVALDSTKSILDDTMNDLRIRELEQRVSERKDDIRQTVGRAREAVRVAEVDLARVKMEQAQNAAELAANEAEIKRIEPLVAQRLLSELELVKIRPRVETLRGFLPQYDALVASHEQALALAKTELAEAEARQHESVKELAGTIEAVRDAFRRNNEIRQANPLALRAPADGVVTKIFRHPGAIVAEGEPVLRLRFDEGTRFVTGMLPSGMQDAVQVGDTVYVTRQIVSGAGTYPTSVRAVVDAVDAEVLDLFDNSGRAENTTVRGRKVRIRLVEENTDQFIPGEGVVVSDRPLSGLSSLFLSK